MKSFIFYIVVILVFSSCSEVTQRVTYDSNGYCVTTYTNGLYGHTNNDFHISQLVEVNQIDSVKKAQMRIAEEYLKLSK